MTKDIEENKQNIQQSNDELLNKQKFCSLKMTT